MGKRKSKSNPQPEQKPSSGGPKDLWFDEDPLDDSRFDKREIYPLVPGTFFIAYKCSRSMCTTEGTRNCRPRSTRP